MKLFIIKRVGFPRKRVKRYQTDVGAQSLLKDVVVVCLLVGNAKSRDKLFSTFFHFLDYFGVKFLFYFILCYFRYRRNKQISFLNGQKRWNSTRAKKAAFSSQRNERSRTRRRSIFWKTKKKKRSEKKNWRFRRASAGEIDEIGKIEVEIAELRFFCEKVGDWF